MSQSSMSPVVSRPAENAAAETVVVGDADEVHALIKALDDADCRAILEATDEEGLSASELSETCDLPLSTTYRKVDMLHESGLLVERTRLCGTGKHTSEYTSGVEDIVITVGSDGLELRVTPRPDQRNPRFARPLGGR